MGEPGGSDVPDILAVEDEPAAVRAMFGDRVDVVRRFAEWLCGAGVERGLIGPREAGRIWSRHILNCAVVGELVPAAARVVDVGSGAGLPGIPLAIYRPDCSVVLVEPLERRTFFLLEVVEALKLDNVQVVRGRADEVIEVAGGADVVTSRAVAPLGKLMAWSAPLARVDGIILAMKGSSAAEEIERDRAAVAKFGVRELSVLTVGAEFVDPPTVVVRGVVSGGGVRRRGGRSRRSG